MLLPEKLEMPVEPNEELLPAANVSVVPDPDAGVLLEAN